MLCINARNVENNVPIRRGGGLAGRTGSDGPLVGGLKEVEHA